MTNQALIERESRFKAVPSGGPGGQHANKVSTKVTLSFNLRHSCAFSEKEKTHMLTKLKGRLTREGILMLSCDETRSQSKNKEIVFQRLLETLKEARKPHKKRKLTRPSKASVEKRLDSKKKTAQKKKGRQKPNIS
ncbi:MAG: alternative ribosome rescue aminoacyl-tRNA hydrolase ArfB [Flavobacteriaceae bacterium]